MNKGPGNAKELYVNGTFNHPGGGCKALLQSSDTQNWTGHFAFNFTGPRLTQVEETPNLEKSWCVCTCQTSPLRPLPIYANDTLMIRLAEHSYYRYMMDDPGLMTFSIGKHPRPQDQVRARLKAGTIFSH